MTDNDMTVIDLRPETDENDNQSDETTRRPDSTVIAVPTIPWYFVALILGLGLFIVGVFISMTPPT